MYKKQRFTKNTHGIAYISSIGIIGLGIGLVLAKPLCNILRSPDTLSLSEIKAIFWLGIGVILLGIVGFGVLGVLKPRILWLSIGMIGLGLGLVLAASCLEISILSDIKAILGLGIAMVFLGGIVGFGVLGVPKPQTLWLSVGIIGLGLGLVLAFLLEISILPEPEIKAIFWLGIGIVLLGIVGFGVLGVSKPRILWLSAGIIGLGVGLIFAETLDVQQKPELREPVEILHSSPKDMTAIFRLGQILVGIGVMILGFAVFKHNMTGILGVVVSVGGIILGNSPDDDLLDRAKYMLFPLHSIATNTANVDTTLKNVEKHINSTLQYLNKHTDTLSRALHDSLAETEKRLIGQIRQLSEIKQISKDLKSQEDTINSIKKALKFQDSLATVLKSQKDSMTIDLKSQDSMTAVLKSQKDSMTIDLKSQEATIESIKNKLAKTEKAQNSVRLLIGTEEKLKEKGFLKTKQILVWKSYWLVKELSAEDTLVTTRKPFPLESAPRKLVDGPGPLKLKVLVYHSGKLKKYAYNVLKRDSTRDSTYVTFKSFLGGMDILAVVEIDKKK